MRKVLDVALVLFALFWASVKLSGGSLFGKFGGFIYPFASFGILLSVSILWLQRVFDTRKVRPGDRDDVADEILAWEHEESKWKKE